MRPGLARCPPDQAQGIKPKAGLSKDRAQFFPVLGEGFDLGRHGALYVAVGLVAFIVVFVVPIATSPDADADDDDDASSKKRR